MDTAPDQKTSQVTDADADLAGMTLRPLTPALGMQVTGIRLADGVTDAQYRMLRRAFVDHGVLRFPGQHLTPDQQVNFSRLFGHVPPVPDSMFLVHDQNRYVSVLENDAERPPNVNTWHSDYSFAALPDLASVLQAEAVPDIGGDTVWASMFAAYDGLSDKMKARLDGLTAVHDFMELYRRPLKKALWEGPRAELMHAAQREFPPVSHPVVITHPENGRKALFVNDAFTSHINDMTTTESRSLLGFLFEQAKIPEYQLRLSWQPGDLVMWDNRSMSHYAVADYHPHYRRMHRVTVLERARDA